MALPSSGPISISQIQTELSNGNNSLRALSAAVGFSTPDSMSEFYGYSAAAQYYSYYVEVYTCYYGSCVGSSYSPPDGLLSSSSPLDVGRYYPDASGYLFLVTGYYGYGTTYGQIFNQIGPSSPVCYYVCEALGL
jgi:hypothetical protein